MQKVLWHIVDINKTNADIQIKATEKLQDLTMILVGLYHTLPQKVSFGLEQRPYIDRYNIKDFTHYNLDSKSLITGDELLQLEDRLDR